MNNQVRNGHVSTGSTAGGSLPELAEKLSELRKDLDEVIARVHREDRMIREEAHAARPDREFGMRDNNRGGLRCHQCGQLGSTDQAGWTLRLCGDNELHPFCPTCDHRHVTGNGASNGNGAQGKQTVADAKLDPLMHDFPFTVEQAAR